MEASVDRKHARALRRLRASLIIYAAALAIGLVFWLVLAAAGVTVQDLPRNAAIYVGVWTLVEGYLAFSSWNELQDRLPSERKIEREIKHLG